jgi:hypothetical protein
VKKLLIAAVIAAGIAIGFGGSTSADPITCPSGQVSTNDHGTFSCINGGGNDTGAVRPKGGNGNFSGPQYD